MHYLEWNILLNISNENSFMGPYVGSFIGTYTRSYKGSYMDSYRY